MRIQALLTATAKTLRKLAAAAILIIFAFNKIHVPQPARAAA
jgi:hypothetical protein